MDKIIESAKTLVEAIRKMPALQALPGFLTLEELLIEGGTLEEQSAVEASEIDPTVVDLENEIGPLFWIGVFSLPDPDTGEMIEMPLAYKTSSEIPVITYTANLENIPNLIKMCNTISKGTGYPWRMIEYRANSEWDKSIFMAPATNTVQ